MQKNLHFIISGLALAAAAALVPSSAQARGHWETKVSVGVGLPHGAVRVSVGHEPYFYHGGVFYRHNHNRYFVVRPPRGAFVRHIPRHFSRVYVGGTVYFRDEDIYYRTVPGGYVVVDEPVVVEKSTPAPADSGYLPVWAGDREYFIKDGQFFRKTPQGYVWTEAVLGATTQHLPDDAVSVWYEDQEYFESKNLFFKNTPKGFTVVETPWKGGPAPESDGN